MSKKYLTKEEIISKAKEAVDVPFLRFDKNNRLKNGKGDLGQVIEEGLFGLKVNNRSEPDFNEVGVELKVTPYKTNKDGSHSSKERLVLNIINYKTEYGKQFEQSSFWLKNKTLLIMFYEYILGKLPAQFSVSHNLMFNFPEEDLLIIKKDWKKIIEKINAGKAEEISEADTLYLGACTKGANKNSLREQQNSNIKAMQRAYSLKQSYMTYVLRKYVLNEQVGKKIIKNSLSLKKQTFEDYVVGKIKPYFGRSQKDLLRHFHLKADSKSVNEILLGKILGVDGKVSQSEEFIKAGIMPKTIRVENNGSIKESMSFPKFKFKELAKENWENSSMRKIFEGTKFMFVVFKYNEKNELILENVKFWNMPYEDILEFKKVWIKTKEIIKRGVKLKKKKGVITNNLPKASDSSISHVRPHARDSKDVDTLPNGKKLTKQCFWLNNDYILKQID